MLPLPRVIAHNHRMLFKLLVVVSLMFGFGYALVPMYRAICNALGINVLTLSDKRIASGSWFGTAAEANTQVDLNRTIMSNSTPMCAGPGTSSPRSVRCKCTRVSWPP